MKKRFNIDDYKGKYAMNCNTEEKAKVFCDYLDSIGRTWNDGSSYTSHTNWGAYTFDLCYRFNFGKTCSKGYYERRGYKILEFDDFLWGLKSKSSPKPLKVTAVDFVPPKTIISWSDGSTTVVKCTACVEKGTEKCIYCKTQSDWRESGIIHAIK